jgi:recombination protein RecR
MAATLPPALRHLVQAFTRLPGVGEKTALRFAMHLVTDQRAVLESLGHALGEAASRLATCESCGNVAERANPEPGPDASPVRCSICSDSRRDASQLCVVAKVQDLMAVERSGAMRGRYFVLGRLLSPLDGVGPEELPLAQLDLQITSAGVQELVIATPPSVEGEATALHLAREFGRRVRVTRIASGIPHGGDLEFADPITLGRAMAGRRGLDG